MTKHTILFQYYQVYQNQNNGNDQNANQSSHHHKIKASAVSSSFMDAGCLFFSLYMPAFQSATKNLDSKRFWRVFQRDFSNKRKKRKI